MTAFEELPLYVLVYPGLTVENRGVAAFPEKSWKPEDDSITVLENVLQQISGDTSQKDIYSQILELKAKENARILTHKTDPGSGQTINTVAQGPISAYIKRGKDDQQKDCYLLSFFIDVPGKVGRMYANNPAITKK